MSKHSNLKKVLSSVLALMMVLGSLVVVPLTATAASTATANVVAWDGTTYDYTPFSAAGTKADPYEISTGAQLAALSQLTNGLDESGANTYYVGSAGNEKYFVLTNDIDMGGHAIVPIRFGYIKSSGSLWDANGGSYIVFDGADHTIYNLKVIEMIPAPKTKLSADWKSGEAGRGLIGELGPNSTVKNLHLVSANIDNQNGAWYSTGFVIGRSASAGVTVSKVTVDASSKISSVAKAGLIGDVLDATTGTTGMLVEDCVNAGTISTRGARIGGIIGCLASASPVTINRCIFNGTIAFTAYHGGDSTGGILGGLFPAETNYKPTITIQNSINLGTFKIADGYTVSSSFNIAGIWEGVQSQVHSNATTNLNIVDCYDYSVRQVAFNANKHGALRHTTSIKVNADSKAVKHPDSTKDFTNKDGVVDALTTAITVDTNRITTVAAEIFRIGKEVEQATGADIGFDYTPPAWDGKTLDDSWLASAGTQANPYVISTGEQLAAYSAITNGDLDSTYISQTGAEVLKFFNNKYFVLAGDINMGGKPIKPIMAGFLNTSNVWNEAYGYGLTFDGQGHAIYNAVFNSDVKAYTVSGATSYANGRGLFGILGNNSTVQNLNFVNCDITGNSAAWAANGFVAGYASPNTVTFKNITVDETSSITGTRVDGGIVGYAIDRGTRTDAKTMTFENCVISATLNTHGHRSAGILGCVISGFTEGSTKVHRFDTFKFINCVFDGNVKFTSNEDSGTFAGIFNSTMDYNNEFIFEDCASTASYTAAYAKTRRISDVFGTSLAANKVSITNCYGMSDISNLSGTITHVAFTPSGGAASITDKVINSYGVGTTDYAKTAGEAVTVAEGKTSTVPTEIKRIQSEIAAVTGYEFADALDKAWDGVAYDYGWYLYHTGRADDPYEISNGAELAAWSKLANGKHGITLPTGAADASNAVHFVNKTFKLTADIDMGGYSITPIRMGFYDNAGAWHTEGGSNNVIDGNNHAISNLLINGVANNTVTLTVNSTTYKHYTSNQGRGVFEALGEGTTVQNLRFANVDVKGASGNAGAGILAGVFNPISVTIRNVDIDADCYVEGGFIIGGMLGMTVGASDNTDTMTIQNCINAATVKGGAGIRQGGFIGSWQTNTKLNMTDCVFAGSLLITANNYNPSLGAMVGIVMRMDNDVEQVTLNLTNCVNLGTFKTVDIASKTVWNSGTVGNVNNATTTINVVNCYDYSYRDIDILAGNVNGACSVYPGGGKAGNRVDSKSKGVGTYSTQYEADQYNVDDYAEIKDAVEAILKNVTGDDAKLSISYESANLSIRMGLTDEANLEAEDSLWGFMAITSAQNAAGKKLTLAQMDEMFEDYGFAFITSDTPINGRQVYEQATKVSAQQYKTTDVSSFYAIYEGQSSRDYKDKVYFVAYAVDDMGLVYLSETREMVMYDTMAQLVTYYTANGKVDGTPKADLPDYIKAEIYLYQSMLDLCDSWFA